MSRDPHDEIRIGMQFGNQLSFGCWVPIHHGRHLFDADRYVRSDDHQLTFRLTLIKFTYEPVITFSVKRAMPVAERAISIAEDSGIIGIVITLGIVEHDNLEWYTRRVRLEGIAGESRFYVRLIESVSLRTC